MLVIYKYTILPTFEQSILMPLGAKVLSVQWQYGNAQIWALVDTNQPFRNYNITTIGTGHEIESLEGKEYIGTYQTNQGEGNPIFVGHVFITQPSSKSEN